MPDTTACPPTKVADPVPNPKPGYNAKPGKPSDSYTPETKPNPPTTYTPTPVDTYTSKPPVDTYGSKPPVDTYGAKPPVDTYTPTPHGDTYNKPPSDPTYGVKVPPATGYSTTTTTYTPAPPVKSYTPNPSHGPGYIHKDCSCGTTIPEECSCNIVIKEINIQGRIRQDVKNCSYQFDLPCHHICVLYGVRTSICEQIVNITVRRKSERKPHDSWTLEGKADESLLNVEDKIDSYNVNIKPDPADRVVTITFQSFIKGEYRNSDMRYKQIVISSDTSNYCSYFYNFFVEAGDADCDYHDTDFCVSVIPCKKSPKTPVC